MAKRGRKTLFKKEMIEEAEKLAALGLTMRQMAYFWGRSERSIHRWADRHEEFGQAIKRGKTIADTKVIDSLYKKAIGYPYTEKTYKYLRIKDKETGEIKEVKFLESEKEKFIPPSDTAIIFWTQNRMPDQWKDRRVIDNTGTVVHRHVTMKDLKKSFESYQEEKKDDNLPSDKSH